MLTHFLVACVANCLREVGSGNGIAEAGRVIADDVGGLLAAIRELKIAEEAHDRAGGESTDVNTPRSRSARCKTSQRDPMDPSRRRAQTLPRPGRVRLTLVAETLEHRLQKRTKLRQCAIEVPRLCAVVAPPFQRWCPRSRRRSSRDRWLGVILGA